MKKFFLRLVCVVLNHRISTATHADGYPTFSTRMMVCTRCGDPQHPRIVELARIAERLGRYP